MSKSDAFENDIIDLFFNGTAIADLAENDTTAPATDLYLSLHTTPGPGDTGNQTTNEAAYTNYARQAVARTSGGFTVSGSQVTLAANVDFPVSGSGPETITHFGIGTAVSGTGYLMYHGTVTPNIVVNNGVQPRLTTSTSVTED